MLSVYSILAIVTYVAWKVWVISDRYQRLDRKLNHVLGIEICYGLMMLYFLVTLDPAFFSIALLTAGLHVCFGIYVEVFRPEVRLVNPSAGDVLLNFWSFLAADTAITFFSYFLILGGQ